MVYLEERLFGTANKARMKVMVPQIKSDRSFLSTGEASERTHLSARYIQRLLQEGRLEGFKASSIWFVYEDSLSAFTSEPRKRGPKKPLAKNEDG